MNVITSYKKIPLVALFLFFFYLPALADSMHSPLSSVEERRLMQYARTVLEATVLANHSLLAISDSTRVNDGLFVTLVKNNQVRGCYGTLFPDGRDAYALLREFVAAAATADFRHSPVHPSELKDIVIVISFIGAIEPVFSISEIDPKTEGLLVRGGGHAAVLLPGEARTASWQIREAKRQAGVQANETVELYRIHTATLYER